MRILYILLLLIKLYMSYFGEMERNTFYFKNIIKKVKSIFGKSKMDKKNVQNRKAPLKTRKKLFSLHN